MAKEVIKRDGSKEPFNEAKLRRSIEVAAREAGLDDERVQSIVESVGSSALSIAEDKEEIATSELREHILGELDSMAPSVAQTWRRYDESQ